jgi:CheY-like chemotaxis protein
MSTPTDDQLRVLIVEDDAPQAALIAAAFRRSTRQPRVGVALDGEQALTQLRTASGWRPAADVVVMDLWLPGLSGLEVLGEMRTDASLRLVPVVVLSSSDRPEDVDAAYEAGANAYVTKPTDFPTLAGIAEAICALWGSSARPSDVARPGAGDGSDP